MTEHHILLFMIQVLVVLGAARVIGEVFRYFNQPPLAGEIIAGVLLGQTVFGQISPDLFATLFPPDELQRAMFGVAAEIGILFLLLVVGLEVNIASAWKMRNRTLTVAVSGVVVPLALGTAAAWLLYDQWVENETPRLAFSLLVGAGVAITAITVVARLLFDLKIIKSDLGLFLVSAMALNELLGWVVLAVVLGLVGAGGGDGVNTLDLVVTMGGILLFAAFAATVGRWLATRALMWIRAKELPSPGTKLSFVVCLGLAGGIVTSALGVHPVFGFMLAGMMAGDPAALSEHTRSIIAQMVKSIFVPLFFAGICLHVDFASDFNVSMVLVVTALSVGGKFIGAWIGARLARMGDESVPVGLAHIPGGPMGVLLASVAKEAGVIGPKMFVALVVASIVSALLVGPLFAWSLARQERRTPRHVARFFGGDRVVNPIVARTTTEAIEALAERAAASAGFDAELVCAAAIAREEAMGTGVGNGVAVPHARIAGVDAPMVVLGVSKEGIEWNAIDDKPVHLVFLIITPEDDHAGQLAILGAISRALKDPEDLRALVETRSAAATWKLLEAKLPRAPGL